MPKRVCKKQASAKMAKPWVGKKMAPIGYPMEDCYREPAMDNCWVFIPKGYGKRFEERAEHGQKAAFCPHCRLKPCVVEENLPDAQKLGTEMELNVSTNNESIRAKVEVFFKSLMKGYFKADKETPMCVKDFCWKEFPPEDEISVGSTSSSEISFQPVVFRRGSI
jgi:hypothetical protein